MNKHQMESRSPQNTNDYILRFCKLHFKLEPKLIPVKLEKWAMPLNCFGNVATKVRDEGGKIIAGYVIWESDYMIEGEYHAVYQKDGEFYCITPQVFNQQDRIMFVPEQELSMKEAMKAKKPNRIQFKNKYK